MCSCLGINCVAVMFFSCTLTYTCESNKFKALFFQSKNELYHHIQCYHAKLFRIMSQYVFLSILWIVLIT